MKWRLKLFVKNLIPLMGGILLFIFGRRVNKDGWDKRILIIYGGGIGDVVKRTAIAGLVKEYLADREVHYLSPYDLPLPGTMNRHIFKYSKAKTNPFYYFSIANEFRKIGFSKIIVLLPLWEGFLPFLGVSMGAETVYCDNMMPPDDFARSVERINRWLRGGSIKHHMKVINVENGWDRGWDKRYFPSDVWRELSFVSKSLKDIKPELQMANEFLLPLDASPATALDLSHEEEAAYLERIGKEYSLKKREYCVIGLGSSDPVKDWPPEKFAAVAEFMTKQGFKVVVMGVKSDLERAHIFKENCKTEYVDLVGRSPLAEVLFLIRNCAVLVCNDTSFAHIGVALASPMVCAIGLGNLGSDSDYGYRSINRWVFPRILGRPVGEVEVEDIIKTVKDITERKDDIDQFPDANKFEISYFHNDRLELKENPPR